MLVVVGAMKLSILLHVQAGVRTTTDQVETIVASVRPFTKGTFGVAAEHRPRICPAAAAE